MDQYTITVTVADDDGGTDTDGRTTVTVANVDPEITELTVAPATVDENGLVTVTGQFDDPGVLDVHTVIIDWGDDTPAQELTLDVGDRTFNAEHQYLDDGVSLGTGTPSDEYTITVTVVDDDNGQSTEVTRTTTVVNVAPEITDLTVTSPIDENGTATLTVDFDDPGTLDVHTVTINWGDGNEDTRSVETVGQRTLIVDHQYLDDPADAAQDSYTITVTVSDDDTGVSAAEETTVVVQNVLPVITSLTLDNTNITEGDTTSLLGSFTDLGTADTHLLDVDWDGDGVFDDVDIVVTGGTIIVDHTFRDDHPTTGTGSDLITVRARLRDDDGGTSDERTTSVTINNEAPEIKNLSLDDAPINEGGSTTLRGTFTDAGLDDSHKVTIDWGDGKTDTVDLDAGETSFAIDHQYDDDGESPGNGTSQDDYSISVTLADDDTGSDQDSIVITVNNVDPVIDDLTVDPDEIDEDGSVTLTVDFSDPGDGDVHTVVINWGDGTDIEETILAVGARTHVVTHQYLDDDPTGTPQDEYEITVTITDDDAEGEGETATGSDTEVATVTVNNVAPKITSLSATEPGKSNDPVTLTGEFEDPGTADTHTVNIDWGDGETDTIERDGERSFEATHQYDDSDDASAASRTISVTVTDDDTGSDSSQVIVAASGILRGYVHLDNDHDGEFENGMGVAGVTVTLTRTDVPEGDFEPRTFVTQTDGSYVFTDLPEGTYTIAETQPEDLMDGEEMAGTLGGTVGEDEITDIVLGAGEVGSGYNFAEVGLAPKKITILLFLASTPSFDYRDHNGTQRQPTADVDQDRTEVIVKGSDRDDIIELTLGAGDSTHTLIVNGGEAQTYKADEVTSFKIDGGRGKDSLSLSGTAVDEVLRQFPLFATLRSSDYDVEAKDMEDVSVDGGSGEDTAYQYDSMGDDLLEASDESSVLSGRSFRNEAMAFELLNAFSNAGGDDEVEDATDEVLLTLEGDWTQL
jgi:hypothetical protein